MYLESRSHHPGLSGMASLTSLTCVWQSLRTAVPHVVSLLAASFSKTASLEARLTSARRVLLWHVRPVCQTSALPVNFFFSLPPRRSGPVLRRGRLLLAPLSVRQLLSFSPASPLLLCGFGFSRRELHPSRGAASTGRSPRGQAAVGRFPRSHDRWVFHGRSTPAQRVTGRAKP